MPFISQVRKWNPVQLVELLTQGHKLTGDKARTETRKTWVLEASLAKKVNCVPCALYGKIGMSRYILDCLQEMVTLFKN